LENESIRDEEDDEKDEDDVDVELDDMSLVWNCLVLGITG